MSNIVILSGAGLSAESGISTFRDANGLWNNHRVEDIATYSTWRTNRSLVHDFYNQRRVQLASVVPNSAHEFYAMLGRDHGAIMLTQNVDNLLERAGYPAEQLVHLHGVLTEMHCENCDRVWDIGETQYNGSKCPTCGSVDDVKPNVVMFGQSAPNYQKLWSTVDKLTDADTFIVVGTMGNVIPVNSFVKYCGARRILNNLEESPDIDTRLFTHVYHKPATEAIVDIRKVLGI